MRTTLSAQLLLALALCAASGHPASGQTVQTRFEESDAFIMNPDCGWVAYNYEDSYDARSGIAGGGAPFAYASVIYTRHPREAWRDAAGGFAQSAPVKLLQDWMDHRRDVAFRIYANTMDDLPPALRPDVDGVSYPSGGGSASGIAYWDEDYIADHRQLVQRLGQRFDGSPYLAFVDVGGVGNTGGEWYLDPREPFARAGLDDERFYGLVKSFVEMYRQAFPRTRLFISYECVAKAGARRQDVVDLLVKNDIGVRDDGLGGWPYPRQNVPAEEWPMPTLWQKLPACFEGGGGGIFTSRRAGREPDRVLDWLFKQCPPTYVNIGGSETICQRVSRDMPAMLERYGNRIGYRLALLSASVPAELKRGGSARLQMQWANRGIAPCYTQDRLEVSLFDAHGSFILAEAVDLEPSTREWAPGQEVTVQAAFGVPATVPAGDYALRLRLLTGTATGTTRAVQVATKGADAEGRFAVGTVHVTD
jgi:hypothetical protein